MPNPKLWSKVVIALQSALATAVTISGITKANPGVVSFSGTDPANGDYVLLLVTGMNQINGRVFRVASLSAGVSFELEGEDTTLYDTFAAGTAQVITFGTNLDVISAVTVSGGERAEVNVTTVHDDQDKVILGNASSIAFAMEALHDIADPGLIALAQADATKAKLAAHITFSDLSRTLLYGQVSATLIPTGSTGDKVTTPVKFTLASRPTGYST